MVVLLPLYNHRAKSRRRQITMSLALRVPRPPMRAVPLKNTSKSRLPGSLLRLSLTRDTLRRTVTEAVRGSSSSKGPTAARRTIEVNRQGMRPPIGSKVERIRLKDTYVLPPNQVP